MTLRLPALLLLALCSFAPAHAQAPDKAPDQLRTLSRNELDIVKVLNAQEIAWNKGDLDAFAIGYKDSPDTLFVGEEVTRGYAPMLAHYKKNYPSKEAMGTLSFSDLETRFLDEHFAVVIGRYHLDRGKKVGGPSSGVFSLVFEKTEKGWKIVVDHTS